MGSPAKNKVLLLTPGLDCAEQATNALRQHFEVSSIATLVELQSALNHSEKPHALVMAAEFRFQPPNTETSPVVHLLERLASGKTSLPVVLVTRARKSPVGLFNHGPALKTATARSNVQFLASPFDDRELLEAVDLGLTRKKHKRLAVLKVAAPPFLVFLAFLVAWEFACRIFGIREFVLPPPTKIFAVAMKHAGSLLFDTGLTTLEAALGFLLANVLSLILAVGFCHSKWMENSLYPYTIALKSVPIVAVAPLLVLWFGYGLWGKVVMAAVVAFFPLVVNATLGLKAVNNESLDLMHSLSASKWQILMKLRFPTAIPYIVSALKISSTMAVVGAVVGELAGATRGIGYLILVSSYNLDTAMLFAAITLASLIGIAFFAGLAVIEALFTSRYYQFRENQ